MFRVLRWLIGGGLVAKGLHMLTGLAGEGGAHMEVLGGGLFSFAVLISGAVILAPGLAEWVAMPFTNFIDQIYLPGGRSRDTPEPNHRLAEHYFLNTEWDLAVEEYQKILKFHPRELCAYLALMDIFANQRSQPERAARLFRRGVRKIRDSDHLHRLQEAYRHGVVEKFKPTPRKPAPMPGKRVSFPDLRSGADPSPVEG